MRVPAESWADKVGSRSRKIRWGRLRRWSRGRPPPFSPLQQAGEAAAVHEDVLPRDVSGVPGAQERHHRAELLGCAEAAGGNHGLALGIDGLNRNVAGFCSLLIDGL